MVSNTSVLSPAGNPTCSYFDGTQAIGSSVTWQIDLPDGLADVYAHRAEQAYWVPMTVDGYPAAFTDVADSRSVGDCAISVAVTDKLFYIAQYTGEVATGAKSCDYAKQMAIDVIHNLGGA
jgi:hypothetical protein